MIEHEKLKKIIDFVYDAHQNHNTKKDYRQDGRVPFFTHPLWCALTLLNDQRISFEDRNIGYQALLLHDVLEDTSEKLPDYIDNEVRELVNKMTHETWEEEQILENKSPLVKLLKLHDKISSMYDETVRTDPVRRKEWRQLIEKLISETKKYYPEAKIIPVAETIIANTNW
ncbi:MAG: hypothetical protein WA051_03035 [Minisyncoccia bacterium]